MKALESSERAVTLRCRTQVVVEAAESVERRFPHKIAQFTFKPLSTAELHARWVPEYCKDLGREIVDHGRRYRLKPRPFVVRVHPRRREMKKVAILTVLAIAGALAGVACGGGDAPAKDPSSTTTTTSSGAPADSAAPAASGASSAAPTK
jgi:hypothetical protein